MMRHLRHFFILGVVALAAGCGGIAAVGSGGTGGVSAEGFGGAANAAGGLTASNGGTLSGRGGTSGGSQCQSANDCTAPGPCVVCAGGSVLCPSVDCVDGFCKGNNPVPLDCPPVCDPGYCPNVGTGESCCQSVNGPCGVDYGMGCVTSGPPDAG